MNAVSHHLQPLFFNIVVARAVYRSVHRVPRDPATIPKPVITRPIFKCTEPHSVRLALPAGGIMSRGPGRVERAIAHAFESDPRRYFVHELVAIVAKSGIRASRRSVLRAAANVSKRMGFKHSTEGRSKDMGDGQAVGRIASFAPADFSTTMLKRYRISKGLPPEPTDEERYSPELLAARAAREEEYAAERRRINQEYHEMFDSLKTKHQALQTELFEVEQHMDALVKLSGQCRE